MRGGRGVRDAGFTLVEVLVAFVVLAVVMVAIQRGLVAATAGLARASDLAGAERVARSLLATPFGDVAPGERRSGTLAGRDWTAAFEPVPFAAAMVTQRSPDEAAGGADEGAATWVPIRVRLSVDLGSSRSLDVETVRLTRVGQ